VAPVEALAVVPVVVLAVVPVEALAVVPVVVPVEALVVMPAEAPVPPVWPRPPRAEPERLLRPALRQPRSRLTFRPPPLLLAHPFLVRPVW
jgi:hypothetical protein